MDGRVISAPVAMAVLWRTLPFYPADGGEMTNALPTISISESPGIHSTAMQAREGALPGLK